MSEYKIEKNEHGENIGCACCGCEVPLYLFKEMNTERGREDMWLCKICSSTFLSVALTYPRQCLDAKLFVSIAQLGNMILREIDVEGKYES